MSSAQDRHYLENLARSGRLTPAGLEIALRRLACLPDARAWGQFADRLLLISGGLLVLAGILFFFAFNWSALHRFAKIALVLLPLLLAALMAARRGGEGRVGKACLSAAVVLAGILLAVIGQIYQTGADSEMLFAGWALLVLPWVLVGRLPALWLFWLALLNTALAVYLAGRLAVWSLFFLADGLFWAPLLLNAVAVLLWECLWPHLAWLRVGYGPRGVFFLAAGAATALGVSWCFLGSAEDWRLMRYTPAPYLGWLAVSLWFYQARRRDLFPLALSALSLIVVLTAGLIRLLFEQQRFEISAFLVLAVAVGAMTATAVFWLRRTAEGWQSPGRAPHA